MANIEEARFEISQEHVICITQVHGKDHELVAVIRRNGSMNAHTAKKMGFEATAQLLARIAGQPPFKLEKEG